MASREVRAPVLHPVRPDRSARGSPPTKNIRAPATQRHRCTVAKEQPPFDIQPKWPEGDLVAFAGFGGHAPPVRILQPLPRTLSRDGDNFHRQGRSGPSARTGETT